MQTVLRRAFLALAFLGIFGWLAAAGPQDTGSVPQMFTLDIGSLAPGDSVVITFEVDVSRTPPFQDGVYELSSHGLVAGTNFSDLPTDDPETPEANDPTITLVHDSKTPIFASDLTAVSINDGISISWRMSDEAIAQLAGVLVQRASVVDGPFANRTGTPLPLSPMMSFVDFEADNEQAYWYRLALTASDGTHAFTYPIHVTFMNSSVSTELFTPVVIPGGPIELRYAISRSGMAAKLEIFDVRGRRIRVLELGDHGAGKHRTNWDRRTSTGSRVARGVYIVRLETDDKTVTKKFVIAQ